jgi:cellulose synthase/poly-beta-1,6-N-acetylglucosamine synthase-like glycosyltransferase
MAVFISYLLTTLAILLAIPVTVLFVEVIAAIALPQRQNLVQPGVNSPRNVAVLVPAHDESAGLLPTLADIRAQMRPADRLLVVADNCTDDTAAVAAAAGAEVIVRNDTERKGKGHALAAGLSHLELNPPDVVIIIDADCRVAETAIERLKEASATLERPVQALFFMIASDQSQINSRVAEFAWRVKNWVRPLGLNALGLPCQLMGSGMAFPWHVIRSADLESGSIVEDLKLGLDLALAGNCPKFCPFPGVTSEFPFTIEGIRTQRLRWEHGHIGTILATAPRLIFTAIAQANFNLLTLALDVSIPPLSVLGALVVAVLAVSVLATLLGSSYSPIFISIADSVGFVSAVWISWFNFGRDVLPLAALPRIASYLVGKLPIYRQLLFRRSGSHWIRTDRRKP